MTSITNVITVERRKKLDLIRETMNSYGIPPLPAKVVAGMAYVPFQPNGAETYSPVRAFEAGTMFPCLDKPWYGGACRGGKT